MRPVKDILREIIPHITIFLVAGVISYQFIPHKAPEVEQAEPISDTLKLYQEYARLQQAEDDADEEWSEAFSKYYWTINGLKKDVQSDPDDIVALREWVSLLKKKDEALNVRTAICTPLIKRKKEILKQLETLGEPPPK